jgi:hypothetical protein
MTPQLSDPIWTRGTWQEDLICLCPLPTLGHNPPRVSPLLMLTLVMSTRNTTKRTANQLQTNSANTSPNGQHHPQSGEGTADIQTQSTCVNFQQHTPPIPCHGPDPIVESSSATSKMAVPGNLNLTLDTRPPVDATHAPATATAHQAIAPPVSNPFFKISTARVDKAIDDCWANEDARANDNQDFCRQCL